MRKIFTIVISEIDIHSQYASRLAFKRLSERGEIENLYFVCKGDKIDCDRPLVGVTKERLHAIFCKRVAMKKKGKYLAQVL